MKVTQLESTTRGVEIDEMPCRYWEGRTASGEPIVLVVAAVLLRDQAHRATVEDLHDHRPPELWSTGDAQMMFDPDGRLGRVTGSDRMEDLEEVDAESHGLTSGGAVLVDELNALARLSTGRELTPGQNFAGLIVGHDRDLEVSVKVLPPGSMRQTDPALRAALVGARTRSAVVRPRRRRRG